MKVPVANAVLATCCLLIFTTPVNAESMIALAGGPAGAPLATPRISSTSPAAQAPALPVAFVMVEGKRAGGATPKMLANPGVKLVVKAVKSSGGICLYDLERASDHARISVEVETKDGVTAAVGSTLVTHVMGAGVMLAVQGSVGKVGGNQVGQVGRPVAFIPNEMGRFLMHRVLPGDKLVLDSKPAPAK